MKYKCTRCGDVIEIPTQYEDAPVRAFALIGLFIGLVLGSIGTIIILN